MAADVQRMIAELRELAQLTGTERFERGREPVRRSSAPTWSGELRMIGSLGRVCALARVVRVGETVPAGAIDATLVTASTQWRLCQESPSVISLGPASSAVLVEGGRRHRPGRPAIRTAARSEPEWRPLMAGHRTSLYSAGAGCLARRG
jgi:hypothetical protein